MSTADKMTPEHAAAVHESEPKQLAAFLRELARGQPPHILRKLRYAAFYLSRDEIVELLDEWDAPTGDGNVTFTTLGRLRAMRFELVTEANRLRSALAAVSSAENREGG